jgi:hypothetical protein
MRNDKYVCLLYFIRVSIDSGMTVTPHSALCKFKPITKQRAARWAKLGKLGGLWEVSRQGASPQLS